MDQLQQHPKLYYSILIPFRNEATHLPVLLKSLQNIDFPSEHFEIILIDDHSTDHYESGIQTFKKKITLLKLKKEEGKKAALNKGIEYAKGDVIITTDADCIVPGDWLKYYAYAFEKKNARLSFGGVSFKSPATFFQKLQQVEFSSLIGSGAATINWGLPSMSNGANFAFLKKVFHEAGGYKDNQNIPSGDDEFLLHKVYKKYPEEVFYLKNSEAVVETSPAKDLKELINQRRRWAGKWKYYSNIKNSLLAVLVLMFNLAVITALALIFIYEAEALPIIILLICKAILEGIFLKMILKSLKRKLYIFPFIFLQITYPLYVIMFGITANFGRYHWKGRRHKL